MGSKVNAQGTDRVGIHVESNDRLRGKMIATIKSAVYFKGKKKEGSRSGLESFRLRCMGFVLVARSAMGILILYSELSD